MREPTNARMERVTRSPRAAAMGVATLSGLMLLRWLKITTMHMMLPSRRLATEAVVMLAAQISSESEMLNS